MDKSIGEGMCEVTVLVQLSLWETVWTLLLTVPRSIRRSYMLSESVKGVVNVSSKGVQARVLRSYVVAEILSKYGLLLSSLL
jgi:hypothetical protein